MNLFWGWAYSIQKYPQISEKWELNKMIWAMRWVVPGHSATRSCWDVTITRWLIIQWWWQAVTLSGCLQKRWPAIVRRNWFCILAV